MRISDWSSDVCSSDQMNEGARRKGEGLVYPAAESRSRPPRAHLVQVEYNCGFGSFPCRIGSYTWDELHPLEARKVPVGTSPTGRFNYSASTIMAFAIPPPSHIVCRP